MIRASLTRFDKTETRLIRVGLGLRSKNMFGYVRKL